MRIETIITTPLGLTETCFQLRRAVILKNGEHIIFLEAPAEIYALGLILIFGGHTVPTKYFCYLLNLLMRLHFFTVVIN